MKIRGSEVSFVCGMRLFDTGPRIFCGFVYSGVSYFVSRHYSVYASECGAAPPRGAVDDDNDTTGPLMITILPVFM